MLRIARQTDYAARLVLHLASLEEGAGASIAEIAAQRLLPVPFVRRMLARLAAAGIVRTTRGARGGVQLGRPAGQISLGDVVAAMEGPIALNECVETPASCPLSRGCPVNRAFAALSQTLSRELAAVRFDELARAASGHALAHQRLARRPRAATRTASRRKP